MLLKLENPKMFSDIIAIISELVTEVRIRVDSDGLKIVAIDPANVALVSFKMPSSIFSAFEAKDETIGVNLGALKSVLKRCGAGSSLILQTEEGMLRIEIRDEIKRVFALALVDIEQEEKTMPMLDFTCKVEMSSSDFNEVVEDCAVVGDACSFIVYEKAFIIEARGLNSAHSEFIGEEIKIEGEKGKAKYSLEYLQKFCKACKTSEKLRISFSDDYPMKLEFKNQDFELAFVLAPRVESED